MRIAYISADKGVPVFGQKGCSVHVQELIRALIRQGAEVELFTCKAGGAPPEDLKHLPVHLIPFPPAQENQALFEHALMQSNGSLQRALHENGKFDLVYERYSLWSFAAITHARAMGIPGILEVNAPLIEEEATHRNLQNRYAAELVAKKVFNDADSVFSVSQEVSEYVQSFKQQQNDTNHHIVPNGVNPGLFPKGLKPSSPAAPGVFTIGFVGSLKPGNGLPVLVEALSLLNVSKNNTRLLIVGDGPQKEEIEIQLAKCRLSEIARFTGAVSHRDVPGLLASMDLAVAPYPKLSNFYFSPLKVYEYMAAGLPVVASDMGQLRTLIQDGWNGTLCIPGDPNDVAKAIDNLRYSPELRWFMGKVARKSVLEKHTWNKIARRVISISQKNFETAGYEERGVCHA
ncbi:MAG: glycosyltransferase family 4 protein [Nitrospinota bacterium]